MSKNLWLSIGVFAALLILTWLVSGGKFIFGLFVFPLGLIPLLFREKTSEEEEKR